MDCEQARDAVMNDERGRLDTGLRVALRAHVAGCADCQSFATQERALTELLSQKLPQFAAPLSLKRALKAPVQGSGSVTLFAPKLGVINRPPTLMGLPLPVLPC